MDTVTTTPHNTLIKLLAEQAVRDHLSEINNKKQQVNKKRPNQVLHNKIQAG
jgi:hypothetical protein